MLRVVCIWSWIVVSHCLLTGAVFAEDLTRVLPEGQTPADARIRKPRDTYDKFHPWSPATSKDDWEQQATAIRQQLLVSQGLWPMPAKQPLKPVIHSRVERDDFTVERVYFASRPGHYVTGSLYRPKNKSGKLPGVLCPHGHWANGRFYDAGDKMAADDIAKGGEKTDNGAHSPLQARMITLARMGCVVFHYDMIGYADSLALDHRLGFSDPEAELRLQNLMGLQTWNSIRALDFLLELPDVDPQRIGVTGASGGGTQTFVLGAIDPRPTVAFPAVMVSTNMQGGCVCENASYLRQGINNVAFAACFAPRPLAMSGANDWTIDIETKGLPELKQIWSLYGESDLVHAKCYPQFGHNYNLVAREMMYGWFAAHLGLNLPEEPARERDFQRLTKEEMTVFNAEHPQPADALQARDLRRVLTDESQQALAGLSPRTPARLKEYQQVVGVAARVMFDGGIPADDAIESGEPVVVEGEGHSIHKTLIGRKGEGEKIPLVAIVPEGASGVTVLWVDSRGKSALLQDGKPSSDLQKLLDKKVSVVGIDVFQTGEYLKDGQPYASPVNETFAGYTFGYNRPLLVERVRDIVTAIVAVRRHPDVTSLRLVGTGDAGPWVACAASLAGAKVDVTAADLAGFSFGKIATLRDPNLLPGALKYGGIGGLLTLALPTRLLLAGTEHLTDEELQPLVYADWSSTGSTGKVQIVPESVPVSKLLDFVSQ